MVYKKFIIECDCRLTADVVIEYIDWFSNIIEYVGSTLIFIDAPYTYEELSDALLSSNLEVIIYDINSGIPDEIFKKFDTRITDNIYELIKKADISNDINYFLDLILERGGTKYLSGKEYQRLCELSDNKY